MRHTNAGPSSVTSRLRRGKNVVAQGTWHGALALAVALGACSRDEAVAPRDAASVDADDRDAASVDAGDPPDAALDGAPGALSMAGRCPSPAPHPTCATPVALPAMARTVIDLTDPADAAEGRCDSSAVGSPAIVLPEDPAAYPVLVRISSAGFGGTCTRCGESVPPYGPTRYGVAIDVPSSVVGAGLYSVAASVNDPWRVVSGGCGEACPHPCLSQYLEFTPTTCLSSYFSGLGVATDASDPPVAELVVQLVTPRSVEVCCHLACS